MKKLLLLIVFSCSFMIGCGSENDPRTNSVGGACGFEVVSDYNNVALACSYKSVSSCESKAQSFLNKYPNISCQAEKPNDHSVDPDTFTITPSEIRNLTN